MISPNVETFIGCDSSYRAADIVLYGAPFDSTTSYRPGARFGPSAIRHESFGLETYSPYQNADLTDFDIFDSGDLELCFGSSEAALADIEARAAEILHDGKLPLLLGGEHLVTLGAVRAVAEKYPGLHIIHFDAHADLRDDYLGAKLSHACVLRRCHEIVGDGRIHQFCIRSGERAEFEFAAQHTEMHKFDFTGLAALTEQLCATKEPVYLTIDLDCLDPSCFPGTGTPEAGGVSFLQLLDAIRTVSKANIVGADLNELAPMLDISGVSTATACKVLRELYTQSCSFEIAQIFPGIPEYFDPAGRGMYPYLTGAASWLVYCMLTQCYGVRGQNGDLLLAPQLLADQFDATGTAAVTLRFAGRPITVRYRNPAALGPSEYTATRAELDGKTVQSGPHGLLIPRTMLAGTDPMIINVALMPNLRNEE